MPGGFGSKITRGEFIGMAGAGAAGLALLGAGCGTAKRLAGTPGRPALGRQTNVVLVVIDSLRKDHVGAYGNRWIKTPSLDALSEQSLRFTRAYPESFPTICARRAIHTGRRTWPFRDWKQYKGVDVPLYGWAPIPREQATLAETLRDNGYATMFSTDNLHQYKPSMNFHRGFDAYEFFRGQTTDGYKPPWTAPPEKVEEALGLTDYFRQYFANVAGRGGEEDWFPARVFSRAMEFLEAGKAEREGSGRPFFLTVDCYDPHAPYDPPEEYVSLYDEEPYGGDDPFSPSIGSSDYLTQRQLERMRARYAGEVTLVDRWLGRFLDKMDALGLAENTLLVLIADHGIIHGEHGLVGKFPSALYPELTDVPFMIRHPAGDGAATTTDHFASTHDVATTILGALGIEPPQPMDGQNLSVLLNGDSPEARPHFTAGYHDHTFARDEDRAIICKNDGSEAKLFDLREDPGMKTDVSAQNPGVAETMFEDYVIGDAGGPLPNYEVSGGGGGG